MLPLIIAGIKLPIRSRLDYQQSFSPIVGGARRRMSNGDLFSTTLWKRWKLSTSGAGWIPAPLFGINYAAPYEIHCIQPIALAVGEALPPGMMPRSDVGETLLTDEYNVTTRLIYPILTVMSDPPEMTTGKEPSWFLEAEQI